MLIFLLAIFGLLEAYGFDAPSIPGESIYVHDEMKLQQSAPQNAPEVKNTDPVETTKSRKAIHVSVSPGNLPAFYVSLDRSDFESATNVSVMPPKQAGGILPGLKPGDVLKTELGESILASPSVASPIRVRVLEGAFKNAILLGEATLDKDILERVLINFTRIRLPGKEITYQFKGSGHETGGKVGLLGSYHSDELGYFAAEMLAATATGFADSTIERNQNMLGNYQASPSLSNSAKQGAVTALGKSTDRFAEKSRNAVGYTEVKGPLEVLVYVLDEAVEIRQ